MAARSRVGRIAALKLKIDRKREQPDNTEEQMNELQYPVIIRNVLDEAKTTESKRVNMRKKGRISLPLTCCTMLLFMMLTTLLMTSAQAVFIDTGLTVYCRNAALWAFENGIAEGTSSDHFSPNNVCTRGQAMTFLWRAEGCPEPSDIQNPFQDVSEDAYYCKAVLWAAEEGITNGTSADHFSPDSTCTSGHIITFIWRANGRPAAEKDSALAAKYPGAYYTDAIAWAEGRDMLERTNRTFQPSNEATRGETVTWLYRNAVYETPIIGHYVEHVINNYVFRDYLPSTQPWTGAQEDRTYGYVVESRAELLEVLDEVMPLYPKAITLFTYTEKGMEELQELWKVDSDLETILRQYDSCGVMPRFCGFVLHGVSTVKPGMSSEGDYMESYLTLQYSAAGYIMMYQDGIIDSLPTEQDWVTDLNADNSADYSLLYDVVQEIASVSHISNSSSDYDKISAIYDWITHNIQYDYVLWRLIESDDDETRRNYINAGTSYPNELNFTLTYRKGVCMDYAQLFDYLCKVFRLDSYYVEGKILSSGEEHAWNLVRVDGNWYHVDATWDASQDYQLRIYFLVSDSVMARKRSWESPRYYEFPSCPVSYRDLSGK